MISIMVNKTEQHIDIRVPITLLNLDGSLYKQFESCTAVSRFIGVRTIKTLPTVTKCGKKRKRTILSKKDNTRYIILKTKDYEQTI